MQSIESSQVGGGRLGRLAGLVPVLLVALVSAVGCTVQQDEGTGSPAGFTETSPKMGDPKLAYLDISILNDASRGEKEKAQDASRKALEMYEWLSIRPGMTVADVFASGGYNTHLLSRIVGDGGKVLSVMEFYADKEAFDGRLYKVDELEGRIEKGGLNNVEMAMKISDLPPDSVDRMVVVRNYHDVEWVFEGLKRKDVVAGLFSALKPGGTIGIVEVVTDKPGWDEKTHRLNKQIVIDDFTAGGFKLTETSDILANPDDDHSTSGFEEGRHTMDRYLLKFRKPV